MTNRQLAARARARAAGPGVRRFGRASRIGLDRTARAGRASDGGAASGGPGHGCGRRSDACVRAYPEIGIRLALGRAIAAPAVEVLIELLLTLSAVVVIVPVELRHLAIAPIPIVVVLAGPERLVAEASERSAEIAVTKMRVAEIALAISIPVVLAAIGFAPALGMAALLAAEVAFVAEATEASLGRAEPVTFSAEAAARAAIAALRHSAEAAAIFTSETAGPARFRERAAVQVPVPGRAARRAATAELAIAIPTRSGAS